MLLVIANPLVSLWSVGFIPQSYAVIFFMLIIMLIVREGHNKGQGTLIATLILILALVFGHVVVSLSAASLLLLLVAGARIWRPTQGSEEYQYIVYSLKLLLAVLLVYWVFTTIINVIATGSRNILEILMKVLVGEKPERLGPAIVKGNPLSTVVLSYSPLAICATMAFLSWLENRPLKGLRNVFIEVGFLFSIVLLILAIVGNIYMPELGLDRHLGLLAILVLSLISVVGFNLLLSKGGVGRVFVVVLCALLITSAAFGGTFTPDRNPFNVSNAYAVYALITWSNRADIDNLVRLIHETKLYTDWRTAQHILWGYINQYEVSKYSISLFKVYLQIEDNRQLYLILLGGYGSGLTISGKESIQLIWKNTVETLDLNSIIIYRHNSLSNLGALYNVSEQDLYFTLLRWNKVYSGTVEVFAY